MNVRTHTRWMRSSPSPSLSPSPGRRCHFYHGPLGHPTRCGPEQCWTPDTRRIQRCRARPTRVGHCRTPTSIGRAVSDACRASDTVRTHTVSGCPVQRVPWCAFCRKRRFLKSAEHIHDVTRPYIRVHVRVLGSWARDYIVFYG